MSVSEAVDQGRRAVLEAQRRILAGLLDEAEPKDAAALSRELRLVDQELEALVDDIGSNSRKDALAARRKAKEASNRRGSAAG